MFEGSFQPTDAVLIVECGDGAEAVERAHEAGILTIPNRRAEDRHARCLDDDVFMAMYPALFEG